MFYYFRKANESKPFVNLAEFILHWVLKASKHLLVLLLASLRLARNWNVIRDKGQLHINASSSVARNFSHGRRYSSEVLWRVFWFSDIKDKIPTASSPLKRMQMCHTLETRLYITIHQHGCTPPSPPTTPRTLKWNGVPGKPCVPFAVSCQKFA